MYQMPLVVTDMGCASAFGARPSMSWKFSWTLVAWGAEIQNVTVKLLFTVGPLHDVGTGPGVGLGELTIGGASAWLALASGETLAAEAACDAGTASKATLAAPPS